MSKPTVQDFVKKCEELAAARVDYQHCGRTRHGLDCIGVIAFPLKELGVEFEDQKNYARIASNSGSLFDYVSPQTEIVEDKKIQSGDIGLFWFDRHAKIPQHAGVFVVQRDGVFLIHAYQSVGVVCKVPYSGHWPRRLTHVLRIPESKLAR